MSDLATRDDEQGANDGDPPEPVRIGIYVPQLAFSYPDMLDRARRTEDLGFDSFWLYDHLYGPFLPDTPALEGWTLATALLAHTTRLRVGHMVLCATFRNPALLGKMATTLDIISEGRLNFGIGSGSYDGEHTRAGIPWDTLKYRSDILEETLEIVTSMFANESTTFSGKHFQVDRHAQPSAAGSAAPSADLRGRHRREAHASPRRTVRRRVERAYLRPGRTRAQAERGRRRVRRASDGIRRRSAVPWKP